MHGELADVVQQATSADVPTIFGHMQFICDEIV